MEDGLLLDGRCMGAMDSVDAVRSAAHARAKHAPARSFAC